MALDTINFRAWLGDAVGDDVGFDEGARHQRWSICRCAGR
jgi:hypothetical protein